MRPAAMIIVAETAPFQRKFVRYCLTDLVAYLAEHPSAGVLMQGTGGIRP